MPNTPKRPDVAGIALQFPYEQVAALIAYIEALEDENKKLHLLADNLATLANVKPDLDGEGGGGGENFYPDD